MEVHIVHNADLGPNQKVDLLLDRDGEINENPRFNEPDSREEENKKSQSRRNIGRQRATGRQSMLLASNTSPINQRFHREVHQAREQDDIRPQGQTQRFLIIPNSILDAFVSVRTGPSNLMLPFADVLSGVELFIGSLQEDQKLGLAGVFEVLMERCRGSSSQTQFVRSFHQDNQMDGESDSEIIIRRGRHTNHPQQITLNDFMGSQHDSLASPRIIQLDHSFGSNHQHSNDNLSNIGNQGNFLHHCNY